MCVRGINGRACERVGASLCVWLILAVVITRMHTHTHTYTHKHTTHLFLESLPDLLPENAVLVSQSVPDGGDGERCERVEEARSEATETTIAKASVVLHLLKLLELESHLIPGQQRESKE
jgi:hypothetical protein